MDTTTDLLTKENEISAGVKVVDNPLLKKKKPAELNNIQTIPVSRYIENELNVKDYTGKRYLDIVLGFFGLLGFALLYPFIALGIILSSPGPVIFKQKRTGLFGQPFTCYKFRTMHLVEKRSKDGKPVVTQKGDRRIFGFGQFLRKTNLDELPQIINVIRGNMSLVGPRPYPVEECIYWDDVFDDHFYRYTVTPGITGFAQAKGLRGGTLEEHLMRKRLDYDLIYTEKSNIMLDLEIIWLTIVRMVVRKTNGH